MIGERWIPACAGMTWEGAGMTGEAIHANRVDAELCRRFSLQS